MRKKLMPLLLTGLLLTGTEPTLTVSILTESDAAKKMAAIRSQKSVEKAVHDLPDGTYRVSFAEGTGFPPGESYTVVVRGIGVEETPLCTVTSDKKGRLCVPAKDHPDHLVPAKMNTVHQYTPLTRGREFTLAAIHDSSKKEITTTYTPYPYEASDSDGRSIRLTVTNADNKHFALSLEGFTDGEEVTLSSTSCGQDVPPKTVVVGEATRAIEITPAVADLDRGDASVTVTPVATGDPLEIQYEWGVVDSQCATHT
jgi:hypothetical protein